MNFQTPNISTQQPPTSQYPQQVVPAVSISPGTASSNYSNDPLRRGQYRNPQEDQRAHRSMPCRRQFDVRAPFPTILDKPRMTIQNPNSQEKALALMNRCPFPNQLLSFFNTSEVKILFDTNSISAFMNTQKRFRPLDFEKGALEKILITVAAHIANIIRDSAKYKEWRHGDNHQPYPTLDTYWQERYVAFESILTDDKRYSKRQTRGFTEDDDGEFQRSERFFIYNDNQFSQKITIDQQLKRHLFQGIIYKDDKIKDALTLDQKVCGNTNDVIGDDFRQILNQSPQMQYSQQRTPYDNIFHYPDDNRIQVQDIEMALYSRLEHPQMDKIYVPSPAQQQMPRPPMS